MSVNIDKLVKTFIRIRNKRSELSAEFKEADEKLSKQQDKIKFAMLDHCKEQGVDSVKTADGVFYRTIRKKIWTNDWESMYKFVLKHEVPELFEKRLHQTNVKQFLEENPDLQPAGLNVDSEYVISVRKNK